MDFEEWYDQHFGSADPNVVKAGNINLGDRPPVYNRDGTVSTEKSFSIGDEYGREILLPQVVGGKMLSKEDAIQHYRDTGEHLGIYKDVPTANAYAKSIHERQPRLDTPDTFPVGEAMQSIRAAPGWIANRIYQGATKTLPPPPPAFNPWSLSRATQNLIDMTGEGPSAREQEAALPPAPFRNKLSPMAQMVTDPNWSFQRAKENFSSQIPELYNQLKQQILPPGFSPQRGLDSALAPAKWLFNEIRQGVLSDDDLAEIKRNPYSPRSIEAMTQAAISLSRGAGGEEGLPRGAVPKNIWESWKPLPDYKGEGGQIRVDPAGNHYQLEGSHETADGGLHAIVKPVEPPGTETPQTPQEKMISDLAKMAGNDPTTWGELNAAQKQWFQDQWSSGRTPSMKDLPPNLGLPGPTKDTLFDNPFSKFLQDQIDASGVNEPPAEGPPSKPLKPEPGSAADDLQKQQEQADIWTEWSKKHGGQKPDFSAPGSEKHFWEWHAQQALHGRFFPSDAAALEAYQRELQAKPPPPEQNPQFWKDKDIFGEPEPMPPDKPPGYWGNANDRQYSGPLVGQQWADIYATPDMEFTVGGPGTPPPDLTPYNPRNPPNLPPPPDPQFPKYPQDNTILPIESGESRDSWWQRYSSHRLWHHPGDKSFPEPPTGPTKTPKPPSNWDELSPEQQQAWFDRWNPPPHGGNNL